jgi:hypothetical protein
VPTILFSSICAGFMRISRHRNWPRWSAYSFLTPFLLLFENALPANQASIQAHSKAKTAPREFPETSELAKMTRSRYLRRSSTRSQNAMNFGSKDRWLWGK